MAYPNSYSQVNSSALFSVEGVREDTQVNVKISSIDYRTHVCSLYICAAVS